MYEAGNGVPKNAVEAHKWYSLAAADGIELAGDGRDQLAARMTAAQIEHAEELAQAWLDERD